MTSPASFQSMSSSVLPSQEREVLIAKQSALATHGQQTRIALSKLPPLWWTPSWLTTKHPTGKH